MPKFTASWCSECELIRPQISTNYDGLSMDVSIRDASANRKIFQLERLSRRANMYDPIRHFPPFRRPLQSLIFHGVSQQRPSHPQSLINMIFHFLLLAWLTYASDAPTSLLSPAINPNDTLPLSSLGTSYRCAPTPEREPGRNTPTALDCLNILTYILATTPDHDQPREWSRIASPVRTLLPYTRKSGTCKLLVQLTTATGRTTIETATFDEVIGAAMRLIEVCLLGSRPGEEPWGGVAVTGSRHFLDVIIFGTPQSGVIEGATVGSRNGTDALKQSDSVAAGD